MATSVLPERSINLEVTSPQLLLSQSMRRTFSGCSLCILPYSGVGMYKRFDSTSWNTLLSWRNGGSSELFNGSINYLIALVGLESIFNIHGHITRPRYPKVFVKKLYFLNRNNPQNFQAPAHSREMFTWKEKEDYDIIKANKSEFLYDCWQNGIHCRLVRYSEFLRPDDMRTNLCSPWLDKKAVSNQTLSLKPVRQ